jgi:hypothetical protein
MLPLRIDTSSSPVNAFTIASRLGLHRKIAWSIVGLMTLMAILTIANGLLYACNALAQGQFSILCMGLIVGQLVLLENGRHLGAGICWALATIKPQIALPFALAFFSLNSRSLTPTRFGRCERNASIAVDSTCLQSNNRRSWQ